MLGVWGHAGCPWQSVSGNAGIEPHVYTGVRRQSGREAGAEAPRERVSLGQRIREKGRGPERSPAAEWRVARGSSWRGTQDGPRPPLAEKRTAVHRALGPRDPEWPALPR